MGYKEKGAHNWWCPLTDYNWASIASQPWRGIQGHHLVEALKSFFFGGGGGDGSCTLLLKPPFHVFNTVFKGLNHLPTVFWHFFHLQFSARVSFCFYYLLLLLSLCVASSDTQVVETTYGHVTSATSDVVQSLKTPASESYLASLPVVYFRDALSFSFFYSLVCTT